MPSTLSHVAQNTLLRQLMSDWRNLNRTRFDHQMTPPVLALEDTTRTLGRWDPSTRTIAISTSLVLEHPWGAVLEVLKHEMAHQYCHEVLGVTDEGPHGPTFRSVCERLGIDGRAAGAPGSSTDPSRDRVLRRVQRLMALADSPEPHEAHAAMTAAQRLMLKYNIEAHETHESPNYAVRWLGRPTKRIPAWRRILSGILTGHFFVEGVWVWSYDTGRDTEGRVLEVTGTTANLDIAEWVHEFLEETAERMWRAHKEATGIQPNRDRRQYLCGLMVGLFEKLQEERQAHEETGLIWSGDPRLSVWTRRRHQRLRRTSPARARTEGVWRHGRREGRNIVIKKTLSRGRSTRAKPGLLIGPDGPPE